MARGDFKTKRKAGPGRPKGLKNKIPYEARAYVVHVFETLQKNPVTSLTARARENPDWFYDSIWKVIIPKEVKLDGSLEFSGMMDVAISAARKVLIDKATKQP